MRQRSTPLLKRRKSFSKPNITSTSMLLARNTFVSLYLTEPNVPPYVKFCSFLACHSYHVPAHIQHHIDLVTPTVHFNAILNRRSDFEERAKKSPMAKAIGKPGSGFHGPKTSGTTSLVSTDLSKCDSQVRPSSYTTSSGI